MVNRGWSSDPRIGDGPSVMAVQFRKRFSIAMLFHCLVITFDFLNKSVKDELKGIL